VIPPERQKLEELAEEIWALSEIGENRYDRLTRGSKLPDPVPVLEDMCSRGLARIEGGMVVLSDEGGRIAATIIRRHRLAEILFSQVMEVEEGLSESAACEIEHILSGEVTDSVCSFLGHPPTCPHGKAIPRGQCCDVFTREITPLVVPLTDVGVGERCRIVFIATGERRSLDRIAPMGVLPGATVRLRQKRPSVVLDIGHTTLAIDSEIASAIYIRRLPRSEDGRS
jgi:DtxR family Mn-dependent transcriptional regulator